MHQSPVRIYSGTMHFATVGRFRMIVGCDSLGYCRFGTVPASFVKMHEAGDFTLVGTLGMLNMPFGTGEDLVANEIASLCSMEELRDRPAKLVGAIRDRMQGPINEGQRQGSWDFSFSETANIIGAFECYCIKRSPGFGAIDLVMLRWPLLTDSQGKRFPGEPEIENVKTRFVPSEPFFFYAGHEIPAEADLPGPDDDVSYDSIMTKVHGVFDLVHTAHPSRVGPPYSVCVVDDRGLQWLRRPRSVGMAVS